VGFCFGWFAVSVPLVLLPLPTQVRQDSRCSSRYVRHLEGGRFFDSPAQGPGGRWFKIHWPRPNSAASLFVYHVPFFLNSFGRKKSFSFRLIALWCGMQFWCESFERGKLGAGSRVFEEKSEVEEQVPWLRNMVISGHAGYDRQLVPSKTFHCSGVGQGASTNGA